MTRARSFRIIPFLLAFTVAAAACLTFSTAAAADIPYQSGSGPDILSKNRYIAHALGLADGQEPPAGPLNCLEGFQKSYENGIRVFEVDLRFTRDGKLVCRHDWWNKDLQLNIGWVNIPALDQFLQTKYLNKYTPLSFKNILELLEEYPDICIITDTKFMDSDVFYLQFDAMMQDTKELELEYVWSRIIIQCYDSNMQTALAATYPQIRHYLYTMYQDTPFDQTEAEFEKRCKLWHDKHAVGITMPDTYWKPEWTKIAEKYDLMLFVHTINDETVADTLFSQGCNAIYTDCLHDSTASAGLASKSG